MQNTCIETEYNETNKSLTLRLAGEIDHHSASPLREEADRELSRKRPKSLIIDLSGVTFLDSAGLGYILGRYGKAQALGAETEVTGASDQIHRILRLAGADKLIKISLRG